MLQYTPQRMHCLATFWGCLAPRHAWVVAVQNLSNNQVHLWDRILMSNFVFVRGWADVEMKCLTLQPCDTSFMKYPYVSFSSLCLSWSFWKCHGNVRIFGYLWGCNLKKGTKVCVVTHLISLLELEFFPLENMLKFFFFFKKKNKWRWEACLFLNIRVVLQMMLLKNQCLFGHMLL